MPRERIIESPFWIGDIVQHKLRQDELRGFVTQVLFQLGNVSYWVAWAGGARCCHEEYELELVKAAEESPL